MHGFISGQSVSLTCVSALVPVPSPFDYCSLCTVWSGSVIPPALFHLKIVLVIRGLLCCHTDFKFTSSSSVKNVIGILIEIALNL